MRTKQLLHEKVWFPNIESYVKHKIDTCIACQATSGNSRPDPLQMSPLPQNHGIRFTWISVVLFLLVSTFLYIFMSSQSRDSVLNISCCQNSKLRYNTWNTINSKERQWAPFMSTEIKRFMEENDIQHCRITLCANSNAKNFTKPMTKTIRSARVEGRTWKKHLHKFLLNYHRSTPHCTIKFSHAEFFFYRKIKNKLPHISTNNQPVASKVQSNNSKAKDVMKGYADVERRTELSNINIDNLVLV